MAEVEEVEVDEVEAILSIEQTDGDGELMRVVTAVGMRTARGPFLLIEEYAPDDETPTDAILLPEEQWAQVLGAFNDFIERG